MLRKACVLGESPKGFQAKGSIGPQPQIIEIGLGIHHSGTDLDDFGQPGPRSRLWTQPPSLWPNVDSIAFLRIIATCEGVVTHHSVVRGRGRCVGLGWGVAKVVA